MTPAAAGCAERNLAGRGEVHVGDLWGTLPDRLRGRVALQGGHVVDDVRELAEAAGQRAFDHAHVVMRAGQHLPELRPNLEAVCHPFGALRDRARVEILLAKLEHSPERGVRDAQPVPLGARMQHASARKKISCLTQFPCLKSVCNEMHETMSAKLRALRKL